MELFKSLETKTKNFNDPFQHFEINEPLTEEAIKEISNAEIADPRNANLKYDGTRALDGGDGAFRSGIKDGGKAKKLRCYVTKENSNQFPNLTKLIEELRSEKVYKKIGSLIGKDLSKEDGYKAAKRCALNIVSQAKKACGGDLSKIKSCVKLTGFVNSTDDFIDQPQVINGASDLIASIFGDAGMHTRAAVSTNSLPLGVAVEVDAIFELN